MMYQYLDGMKSKKLLIGIQWACVKYVLSLMTESALRLMTEYCMRYPDNYPAT